MDPFFSWMGEWVRPVERHFSCNIPPSPPPPQGGIEDGSGAGGGVEELEAVTGCPTKIVVRGCILVPLLESMPVVHVRLKLSSDNLLGEARIDVVFIMVYLPH